MRDVEQQMPYLSEHPSLPPMRERAASSLGTLLRSLRELRHVADDAHSDLVDISETREIDLTGCIPDALAALIVLVEDAHEAIGATVPEDPRKRALAWRARKAAERAAA